MSVLNRPVPLGPEERLLLWPTVLSMVPLSRSTIQRQVAAGRFPRPRRIGRRRLAWTEAEIRAWIEAQTVAEVA